VQQVSYPNTWVRLQRAGNVFTSYTSADGMTWTAFGTTTLALPATVFLGMATTSHNVAQTVLAQYRNLTPGSALPNTTPPSIPGGLTAVAVSGSRINLSWNASTDNVGVAGYKVLRGGVQIATTSALSYADTALSPSTAYSYTVAAYNTAGNTSAPSSAASATTQAATPPSIPTGLSASAISASQINLSWSASTDPVGVTGYNVMRNGVLIAAVSALTYADTGLSPSTTYPYTVAAFNAAGYTSAPSVPASATTPTGAGTNAAALTWDAVTAPTLSGYRVYYGTAPGTYLQSVGQGLPVGKSTTFTVTGLSSRTRYYFAATAYDTLNKESTYSNEIYKDIP
jgi:chitodextrinase